MRRSEVAAMRWEHVDFETRTLLIPDTKNATPRAHSIIARGALAA
ncbi:MAG: hypothetical protein ACYDEV_02915 [Acidiferrobacter sp.]